MSEIGECLTKGTDQRQKRYDTTESSEQYALSIEHDSLEEERRGFLRGGWLAHKLYLIEVRKMPSVKIHILERLGAKIAERADRNKIVSGLMRARPNELFTIFRDYVRKDLLTFDELCILIPPNDYQAVGETRDILLAILFDWERSQPEVLQSLKEPIELPDPDSISQRIQQIGEQLCQKLENAKRWIAGLQTAKSSSAIRGAYLRAVREGAMSYADFVFLAPIGDTKTLWELRDYVLAFLFDRQRDFFSIEESEDISSNLEDFEES